MAPSRASVSGARGPVGVLFSGGLDSAALIAHLLKVGYEVYPVYVSSGLRWEKDEIRNANRFLRAIRQRRLKPMSVVTLALENAYRGNWSKTGDTPRAGSADSAVFLPARNLLLLTKALLSLSSKGVFTIAIATLKGNPFPDGRRSYFRLLERVLSAGFIRMVRILSPFRGMSKIEVIGKLKETPLHLSFSCISPKGGRHCGRCNKCDERSAAFAKANVKDRTVYGRGEPRRSS